MRDLRRAPLPSGAVSLILPTAQNASAVSPTHEIFNRLLRERIIFLGTEVDDDIANVVCAQLLHLAGDDSERDIWVYINSPGGSVTAGMASTTTSRALSSCGTRSCPSSNRSASDPPDPRDAIRESPTAA